MCNVWFFVRLKSQIVGATTILSNLKWNGISLYIW